MADNIKIVGEILNTQEIPRYNEDDLRLLSPFLIKEDFGQQNDYIEYYVYDISGNLLNINYNYKSFKLPTTSYMDPVSGSLPIIEIDPVKDLQNLGYSSGEFKVQYNFFNDTISDADQQGLFLKEISADRTEIRVGSTTLTNEQIESGSLAILNSYSSSVYFVDYIINFGDNTQAIAVNTALNKLESGYEILFKLYEPLPDNISDKTTLWVVKEKVNPYVFEINLDRLVLPPPVPQLRGPNFAIDIPNQNNVATSYQTFNSLVTSINSISTASYQQFLSLVTSQSIDINTDYTNFNNFVFFSSAKKRVENFYDKVKKIEDYNNDIKKYTISSSIYPSMLVDLNRATASINEIIAGFDGFEYYLYYESGSNLTSSAEYDITPYPKTGSLLPYPLLSTGSTKVQQWYNWATGSGADYDDVNQNKLTFTVPTFIKDDGNNEPYLNFLDMVGHYFDNIWIFLQAITDINLANNNLEKGVSKDLVYYVLESLGTKLYNQYGNSGNLNFLIGLSGSANFDNNFTFTGSYLNTVPRKDLLAESYKRIYHNLPLLLKTKGTTYGLETLISTFGILNRDYYTILDANNSASYWYTPTGSALTSSILRVKEYGGDLKSNTLDEFNNDKVRIVSSSIVSGSVLSPLVSVVQYPTASTQFRTNDLNYVDISFSPQDKIDIYSSASIVAVSASWTIDDIIGDPGYLYSSSYTALDVDRNTFLSPLSASQLPYTASLGSGSLAATDYNSFIRLIQFFDNSLFKMLQDFVPARTSLSTGVTISSPILERNKWSYANPSKTSKVDVKSGSIAGPTITSEYTDIYQGLTGSKAAYYDGVFTGSYINTYQYFESGTFNPYLFPTSSLTAADIYYFQHTDFNVMLNNVSSSVVSRTRKDIEYIYGTTGSILTPAELQDSYETLRTHQSSRYDGVKIYSLKYNTYTSASATYAGDKSYGKTATIDLNSYKVAWVKNIPSQSLNFYDKTSINLKYLVDASNNLTELSRANLNLPEVQRIFKSGEDVILSISDVKVPSNQTTLDGTKPIWKGGYSYDPLLFRENNETLYFLHASPITSSIVNLGVKAFCRDNYTYVADKRSYRATSKITAPPDLPTIANDPLDNYKWEINGVDGNLTVGKAMALPAYTFTSWKFKNNGNKVNFTLPPRSSMGIPNSSNYRIGGDDSQGTNNPDYNSIYVYPFDLLNFNNYSNGGYNTEPNTLTYATQSGSPNNVYKVPRTGNYTISGSIPFIYVGDDKHLNGVVVFKPVVVVERCPVGADVADDLSWKYLEATTLSTVQQSSFAYSLGAYNTLGFSLDNRNANPPDEYHQTYYLKVETTQTLTAGEYVRFRFYLIDISNAMGKNAEKGTKYFKFFINGVPTTVPNVPTLSRGFFQIYDPNATVTLFEYTSSYGQIPQLFNTSSANTLLFSTSASYLFTTASTFVPTNPTAQYYSPVVDQFGIQKYDLIRIGPFNSPSSTYYEVLNVSSSIGGIFVTLNSNINTGSFITNIAQDFAIFRPKPDETSVIINFKKQLGEVSQTILIPNDASETIKSAVGNIFKTLNTDLQS